MVVLVGVTVAQSVALRPLPMVGVIETLVDPVTCQQILDDWPAETDCGVAVKTTICGIALPVTVTVTTAVTVLPSEPVALIV